MVYPTCAVRVISPMRPDLEVANRLHELGLGVHHERTIARHRLAVRNARQEQNAAAICERAEPNDVAVAEDRELTVAHLAAADLDARPRTRTPSRGDPRRSRC